MTISPVMVQVPEESSLEEFRKIRSKQDEEYKESLAIDARKVCWNTMIDF